MNQPEVSRNISIIVAATENGVIGREGGLPWKLKEDMRHFVKTTLGKKILMGRKTFESILKAIGKPLPGRENYVLTRDPHFHYPGVKVFHDVAEVLALEGSELIVAGGAEIYKLFLPSANKIYLTKIKTHLEGDAFFPALPPEEWEIFSNQSFVANTENDYDFEIMELHKKIKN